MARGRCGLHHAAGRGRQGRQATVSAGVRGAARSGHPFVVGASLRDGRFAWCKENPPAGEGAAGTGVLVPLPAACTR